MRQRDCLALAASAAPPCMFRIASDGSGAQHAESKLAVQHFTPSLQYSTALHAKLAVLHFIPLTSGGESPSHTLTESSAASGGTALVLQDVYCLSTLPASWREGEWPGPGSRKQRQAWRGSADGAPLQSAPPLRPDGCVRISSRKSLRGSPAHRPSWRVRQAGRKEGRERRRRNNKKKEEKKKEEEEENHIRPALEGVITRKRSVSGNLGVAEGVLRRHVGFRGMTRGACG